MKRGQVYYDKFVDKNGRSRRIPVMVMTGDGCMHERFVQTVRISLYDRKPDRTHVFFTSSAWKWQEDLNSGYIFCDTISTTSVSDMYGPIAEIKEEWMDKVEEAVQIQLGMKKAEQPAEAKEARTTPLYSAADSPQMREALRSAVEQEAETPLRNWLGVKYELKQDAGQTRFGPGSAN